MYMLYNIINIIKCLFIFPLNASRAIGDGRKLKY